LLKGFAEETGATGENDFHDAVFLLPQITLMAQMCCWLKEFIEFSILMIFNFQICGICEICGKLLKNDLRCENYSKNYHSIKHPADTWPPTQFENFHSSRMLIQHEPNNTHKIRDENLSR